MISETERIDDIALEKRTFADITSDHLFALVPGLLHDVTFMLTGKCGRGRKTRS
jgi:hypothetical protein